MTPTNPFSAARLIGVFPAPFLISGLAPWLNSSLAIPFWFSLIATCNGVHPVHEVPTKTTDKRKRKRQLVSRHCSFKLFVFFVFEEQEEGGDGPVRSETLGSS